VAAMPVRFGWRSAAAGSGSRKAADKRNWSPHSLRKE
jgi:hypothetical protein